MMIVDSVGPSDHMAVLAAYGEWDKIPPQGEDRYEFCRENFLSIKTLQGMSELKRSLLETLSEAGFVRRSLRAKEVARTGRRINGSDGVLLALSDGEEVQPCPPPLLAGLLCAALFPQVATATLPQAQQNNSEAPKPKLSVRDAETSEPVKVKMHPGSVSWEERTLSSPYLVFQELVKSTSVYVRDVTPVPPLALALFSGTLAAGLHSRTELIVDGWIKLEVPMHVRELLLELRRRLDKLLADWVGRRKSDIEGFLQGHRDGKFVDAIKEFLVNQKECPPPAPPPQQLAVKKSKKAKGKAKTKVTQLRGFALMQTKKRKR